MATFMKAVEWMINGNRVKRPTNRYILRLFNGIFYNQEDKVMTFYLKEIEATDWEVVEGEKTLSDDTYHNVDIVGRNVLAKRTSCVKRQDVIESLKKLIESCETNWSDEIRVIGWFENKAKEIFGEDYLGD